MAAQLYGIPTRLYNLSSKLKQDHDVQERILKIARKAKEAGNAFKSVILYEGHAVLLQKTLLLTTTASAINISDMQGALSAATLALTDTRTHVVCLQADMHHVIEICRERRVEYETKLDNILSTITNMWEEIDSTEVIITQLEDDASALNIKAVNLWDKAEKVKKKAKEKRKNVETTGLVGGIVGLALAPFTGGASLALATAATGISAAVNLPQASEYEKSSESLRQDADRKKEKVDELKSHKSDLMKRRAKLQREIDSVQSKTKCMADAAVVLQQVTTFLLPTINLIDQLLQAFQGMESAIKEVLLQNDSFEIMQRAFGNELECQGKYPTKYLNQLKEKWNMLEEILIQHGAQTT